MDTTNDETAESSVANGHAAEAQPSPISEAQLSKLEKRLDQFAEAGRKMMAFGREILREVNAAREAIVSQRQVQLPFGASADAGLGPVSQPRRAKTSKSRSSHSKRQQIRVVSHNTKKPAKKQP